MLHLDYLSAPNSVPQRDIKHVLTVELAETAHPQALEYPSSPQSPQTATDSDHEPSPLVDTRSPPAASPTLPQDSRVPVADAVVHVGEWPGTQVLASTSRGGPDIGGLDPDASVTVPVIIAPPNKERESVVTEVPLGEVLAGATAKIEGECAIGWSEPDIYMTLYRMWRHTGCDVTTCELKGRTKRKSSRCCLLAQISRRYISLILDQLNWTLDNPAPSFSEVKRGFFFFLRRPQEINQCSPRHSLSPGVGHVSYARGCWLGDKLDPGSRTWYCGDVRVIHRAEASGVNPARLSLSLLEALFLREEMAVSNVNGARGHDVLNPVKIGAIRGEERLGRVLAARKLGRGRKMDEHVMCGEKSQLAARRGQSILWIAGQWKDCFQSSPFSFPNMTENERMSIISEAQTPFPLSLRRFCLAAIPWTSSETQGQIVERAENDGGRWGGGEKVSARSSLRPAPWSSPGSPRMYREVMRWKFSCNVLRDHVAVSYILRVLPPYFKLHEEDAVPQLPTRLTVIMRATQPAHLAPKHCSAASQRNQPHLILITGVDSGCDGG